MKIELILKKYLDSTPEVLTVDIPETGAVVAWSRVAGGEYPLVRWEADFSKEPYMRISANGEWVRFVDVVAGGESQWVSGWEAGREAAAEACQNLINNRPTTERGLLIAKECKIAIEELDVPAPPSAPPKEEK